MVSAMNLSSQDKSILFGLVRRTIESVFDGKDSDQIDVDEGLLPETLKVERGVFVTLYRNHEIRGCVGYVLPLMPLWMAAAANARNAAFRDLSFPPLREVEYAGVSIEISVLNEPVKMLDLSEFSVGTHGIILRKGFRCALFLPQVPSMNGWGASETLQHLCENAGIELQEWRQADSIEIFQAEVISEHDPGSAV